MNPHVANIDLAEKLARAIHGTFVNSLPVDVFSIAEALGIESSVDNELFSDGSSFISKGVRYIQVNSNGSTHDRRFLMAHEIGHHVMGHTETGIIFNDSCNSDGVPFQYDRYEVEANRFAAELIMPSSLVISAFKSDSAKTISGIADLFGVSKNSLMHRLKQLRLI